MDASLWHHGASADTHAHAHAHAHAGGYIPTNRDADARDSIHTNTYGCI